MKKLEKCGEKPNCVCSFNQKNENSYFEPMKVTQNPMKRIKHILEQLGIKIMNEEEKYIHSIATTKLFRFKDDVEFLYDEEKKLLHFKSCSRFGHSDLGTNRKRLKKIVSLL